jgi:hypothetical protein
LRPIDEFKILLKLFNPKEIIDKQLQKFIDKHGKNEICAMCLTIYCSKELNDSNSTLTQNAENLFFKIGEEPSIDDSMTENLTGSFFEMGQPITQNLVYSKAHNGLFIYFSRLIRPLWKYPILVSNGNSLRISTLENVSKARFSPDDLKIIEEPLSKMDEFFKNHKALYTPGSKIFSERSIYVEEEKTKKLEAFKVIYYVN